MANKVCSSSVMVASLMASTAAAASPARISLARFGPVSTPYGWPGSTSLITSVMRSRVPCSRPLVRLTTGTQARRCSATCSRVERNPWHGTPMTSTSA